MKLYIITIIITIIIINDTTAWALSHSWMNRLAAELFLNSCFSDTVFLTFSPA